MAGLEAILDAAEAERLATGFVFTEGPLWHSDGFYYFVDVRKSVLYRMMPGRTPEVVRTETGEGNGTTFDLQGRLVICEGGNRRVTRWSADGRSEVLMDRYEGKRINRPNDIVCKPTAASGSLTLACACRFPTRSCRSPAFIASSPTAPTASSQNSNIRTASRSRRTSGCSTSPIPDTRNTSTRSSSMTRGTWCGGGSLPTCPPRRPTACPTA